MGDPVAPLHQKRRQLIPEGYQKGPSVVLSDEGITVGYGLDLILHICNQVFAISKHMFDFRMSILQWKGRLKNAWRQ